MKAPKPRIAPRTLALTWAAQLAAAAALGVHAWWKFTGRPMEVELFRHIGMEPAGRFLIGGIELLAATLLLIPQSAAYGALLGLGVMIGAIIGHLTAFHLMGVEYAAGVAVLCLLVLCIRRHDAEFLHNLWD